MKWFWVVVGIMVVGAAALMLTTRSRADRAGGVGDAPSAAASAREAPPSHLTPAPPSSAPVGQTFDTTITVAMAPKDSPRRSDVAAQPAPAPASPWGTTPPSALTAGPGAGDAPREAAVPPSQPDAGASHAPAEPAPDAKGPTVTATSPSPAPAAPTSTQTPSAPATSGTPPPATAPEALNTPEPSADGAKSAADRFPVVGEGTQEKPYVVTWAWLVSASETYKPKLGQKVLPDRVTMLDGKYVKITGYIAFPYMVQQATETLVMQNQWDGCCIGVPPTPFDAIEVTLRDPASPTTRLMQYGSVEGRLKVEPYLRGQWLISFYSMTDAALTPEM